ncbi:hypothetical protein NVV43_29435, partial [Escherichia marmotae]|nr:hypothetical protein [Escherichia marmotae]
GYGVYESQLQTLHIFFDALGVDQLGFSIARVLPVAAFWQFLVAYSVFFQRLLLRQTRGGDFTRRVRHQWGFILNIEQDLIA